jgi:adenosylmethionine-8-amino-7-oxononanoate aminotransferase
MTDLSTRDKKIIWHPFSQEKTAGLPLAIQSAKGAYLYGCNQKAYLDLISSWWVNLHGHAHPAIAKAIYEQALKLEHVIFSHVTHEPAVELCEKLQAIMPQNLTRFFYSDNGSTAVECALKIAYQYWQNLGKTKTKFACFEGGYHGDTIGAMSAGNSSYHTLFKPLLFERVVFPYPDTWLDDWGIEEKEHHACEAIQTLLKTHGGDIAALILEPLIQGASGMRMCRPEFLNKIIKLVQSYNILIIFDEVMTGFGRTGTGFALKQLDETCVPDIICLSKGLTGGFLPLALTITTQKIYNAFLDDKLSKAFLHGHSYTANPLGCAAAIASLNLLLNSDTDLAIQNIKQAHQYGLALLNQCESVTKIRQLGTISAFTLPADAVKPVLSQLLAKGFFMRPLGNNLYMLPPYCVSEAELGEAYEQLTQAISHQENSRKY